MEHHPAEHNCCQPSDKPPAPWYRRPVVILSAVSVFLLALSFVFPVLVSFRKSFLDYVRMMVVPVGLGFLTGGLMDRYVPKEYVAKHLAQGGRKTVFYAVGLGFLMSACSHGILALSMELHKKGASGPAVVSFLLASPWANLPVTFLLIGFFGWRGLVIILSALVIALITGLLFQGLERRGMIEKNRHAHFVESDFSVRKDMARRIRGFRFSFQGLGRDIAAIFRGAVELADMVLGWVLVGILLASFAAAFVPDSLFHWFGKSTAGLVLTMLLAAVVEVCSEGTAPLAFEIYRRTQAFGNVFAFLMGGVVTDYTEIGLLWANLGPRTALWMLAITLPQVIFLGFIFNRLF